MKSTVTPKLRCAIYTRKSTEEGLELEFNSLHAQRDACEKFIASQRGEGWLLVPDRYDDGGISGATLERPSLKRLLADIEAQRVDIVVIYKIDRRSRSLMDFSKLAEAFERHKASFVSVTQQFNTTTSMGRLTLNVLLSFAQFEREVIGERVRDKISASKKKGLWVGGPVPMGYAVRAKKPVINEATGEQVRWMFQRYLELGCLSALQRELDARGIRSARRRRADGRSIGNTPIGRGALAHILRNRFYIGEVAYKGRIYKGEQPALIEGAVFEAVQILLDRNSVERRNERLAGQALLTGLLFNSRGNAMSPSHANKQGVRSRYYVSQALIQGRKAEAGAVARVSAPDLEERILAELKTLDRDEGMSGRELVSRLVERITLQEDRIEIRLQQAAVGADLGMTAPEGGTLMLIPWVRRQTAVRQVTSLPSRRAISVQTREALLRAIARARLCAEALSRGGEADLAAMAEREGLSERYLRVQLPLAFLSPKVVEAIASGTICADVTLTRLWSAQPLSWTQQEEQLLGFACV